MRGSAAESCDTLVRWRVPAVREAFVHSGEKADMCLAVPGKIIEIDGTTAQVDFGGVTREASLILVPEATVDNYVLVHAGFAIELLNESEAEETLKLFRELARSLDDDRASGSGDANEGNDGAGSGSAGASRGADGAGDAT